MLKFCPLCNKNGNKKRIILQQINLEEAVWLCEDSECPWPFGYQDFTFVLRKVGETRASEWEVPKPAVSKPPESIQIPLGDLGLDTPPVTPGSGTEVVHKDTVFVESTSSVTSLRSNGNCVKTTISSSRPVKDSKSKLRHLNISENESIKTTISREICSSTVSAKSNGRDIRSQESLICNSSSFSDKETSRECQNGFSLSDDPNLDTLDKRLSSSRGFMDACDAAEARTDSIFNASKPSVDKLTAHKSTVKCKKWLSDNTKGIVLGDHCYLSEFKQLNIGSSNNSSSVLDIRLENSSVENLNTTKRLPEIKSIRRTNVKLEEVIPTLNQRKIKEENRLVHSGNVGEISNHSGIVAGSSVTEEKKTSTDSEYFVIPENSSPKLDVGENRFRNCKVETKTIAIEGLAPIILSYEIPSFLKDSMTLACSEDYNKKVKEEIIEVAPCKEQVVKNSVVSTDVKIENPDCLESKNNKSLINNKSNARKPTIKKPLKRRIPKLAKYEGFNFEVLKKKSKTNVIHSEENMKSIIPNILSPDNVSSCSDLTWTSETSSATTSTQDSKTESVDSGIYDTLKSFSSMDNSSLGTTSSDLMKSNTISPPKDGIIESNFDLDQVIDDLLQSQTEDLTQSFEDDWLESLLH